MSITPYGFVSGQVRSLKQRDLTNIKNHRSMAVVPDEYMLYQGVPRVPLMGVIAKTLVSTTGVVYGNRPQPEEINRSAMVRFIPTDATWDDTQFVWEPYFNNAISRYTLDAFPESAPVLTEVDYQNGREAFNVSALSFDEDSKLISNFNEGFDDSYSFRLGIAASIKTAGPYNLVTFNDDSYIAIDPAGVSARVDGRNFRVNIPTGPTAYDPIYIVLDVNPPMSTLVAGFSPTKLWKGTSPVTAHTVSLGFTLSGMMDLYSLDMWTVDPPEITKIIANYSSVFGAH